MIVKKRLLPLIAFFVVLIFVVSSRIFPVGNGFVDLLHFPLLVSVYPGKIVENIFTVKIYEREIDRLKKEQALAVFKLSQMNELARENERLRGQLDLKDSLAFKAVVAQVIARDPDNWAAHIIISKGKAHNIKKGAVAVGSKGLIGIVTESAVTTSRISLVNDPNFSSAAMLERSRAQGLLSGSLFGKCKLRFLSEQDDVLVGDNVITSGLEFGLAKSVFPKGILIGTVSFVGNEASGLGKFCLVNPAENLNSIEEVLLIISDD